MVYNWVFIALGNQFDFPQSLVRGRLIGVHHQIMHIKNFKKFYNSKYYSYIYNMNKDLLKDYLQIEPRRGGSYIFEKECFYRPEWISGCFITKSRIFYHPNNNWIKVEYLLTDHVDNWDKFFEGSINNIEDFKLMLKMIGYE